MPLTLHPEIGKNSHIHRRLYLLILTWLVKMLIVLDIVFSHLTGHKWIGLKLKARMIELCSWDLHACRFLWKRGVHMHTQYIGLVAHLASVIYAVNLSGSLLKVTHQKLPQDSGLWRLGGEGFDQHLDSAPWEKINKFELILNLLINDLIMMGRRKVAANLDSTSSILGGNFLILLYFVFKFMHAL